jgi:hypothetical protein
VGSRKFEDSFYQAAYLMVVHVHLAVLSLFWSLFLLLVLVSIH